jgi:WD40 repeat protein
MRCSFALEQPMKTTPPCSERRRPAFPQWAQTASRALLSVILGLPLLAASAQEALIKELGKAPGDARPRSQALQQALRYGGLLVSPNGERVAYVMIESDEAILVCDDKEGPRWDSIQNVGIAPPSPMNLILRDGQRPFSRDSQRLPYQATGAGQTFLVFAGEDAKPLATPGALRAVYPPDGTRYAYPVEGANGQWFVCDGKEGPHYAGVEFGTFSPDGKRFAYAAGDDKGNRFVVLDGQPLQAYGKIGTLTFSPDGKRLAYIVGQSGNQLVVCDGKEGRRYADVRDPVFSPDGKSLAYWAFSAPRTSPGPVPSLVIWDEKEVAQLRGEPRLTFSPDSRVLACGNSGGEMYRFGDKSDHLATSDDSASRPVFSPDSQHLAYAIGKDMKWRLCVDGKNLSGTFDPENAVSYISGFSGDRTRMLLDSPGFSADGQHVFAKGFRGPPAILPPANRSYFIVCDGIEGPRHDGLWLPEDFRNHSKRLRYVVQDGDRLRLMEWTWPKDRTWQDAVEQDKSTAAGMK